jgi:cytochrome c oxidase subunit I
LFAFGGVSGLTNASYNANLVVHNTSWVPGHFHLTVGSAVTLTFFGIAYWLVPKLSGKPLFSRKMGLWQGWTWFVGMILMSSPLHMLGLWFSTPRRTMLGVAPYRATDWEPFMFIGTIGALILLVSGILFYLNIVGTLFSKQKLTEPIEMPVAEPLHPGPTPSWLENWRLWLAITIALILIAYGPVLIGMITNLNMTSPGFPQ